MFDNTAGDISNFKVEKAFVHNCKRGISLSASHEKNMTLGVLNFISSGNDVGVMVATMGAATEAKLRRVFLESAR